MTHSHIAHYLWPLTLAVVLVNVALGYWRSRALVSSGRITEEERTSFSGSAVLLSSVYCLFQWSIQAASHTPDPLCLLAFPPHGRFAVASWLVAVSTLALVLRWLWRGDGADLLARLGPAYLRGSINRQLTARQVRLVLTAVLLVSVGGNIIFQLTAPSGASACAGPSAAA